MVRTKENPDSLDDTTQIIMRPEIEARLRSMEKIPSLIVIDGEDSGQIFKLTSNAVSIGRSSGATIRINDKAVSRKHFLLEVGPAFVTFIDLQSSNGTYVNGERTAKKKLVNGDKIRVGNTTLKFEFADSDESEFHERLYHLITFDDLTSLYNRKYLMNFLDTAFRARKQFHPLTILFLDLDHFKLVNDNYDHLTGSDVLSEFGRLLLSNLRSTDMACRYGGEEFILILQDTSALQAIYVAEKIRKLTNSHTFVARNGKTLHISVSIGIAEKSPSMSASAELIAKADEAMYKAKESGRNRTVLFREDDKKPFVVVTPTGLDDETPPFGSNVSGTECHRGPSDEQED